MRLPTRALLLTTVFTMVLSACSGSTATSPGIAIDAPASSPSTITPTSGADVRPLMEIAERSVIAPGTWTTPLLGEPLTLKIAEPLTLTRHAPGFVAFALPDEPSIRVSLLNPTGVTLGERDEFDQLRAAAFPTDLGDWFEENEAVEILDQGVLDNVELAKPTGDTPRWFDVATSASAPDDVVVRCSLGERCLRVFPNLMAGVVAISEPDATRHRVYELHKGIAPVVAIVSSPPGASTADIYAIVDQMANSVCVCGPRVDLSTVGPERFDRLVGTTEIPAGVWRTTIVDIDVDIRTSEPLAYSLFFGEPTPFFAMGDPQASAGVLSFGAWNLLDRSIAADRGNQPLPGLATRNVEAWAADHPSVSLLAKGTTSVGNAEATWFDIRAEIVEESGSFQCETDEDLALLPVADQPPARCVSLLSVPSEGQDVSFATMKLRAGQNLRIIALHDYDLMFLVEPDLATAVAQAAAVAEPLLAAFLFAPSEPDPNEAQHLAELESAWIDAIAATNAVPARPDLEAWCNAALTTNVESGVLAETPLVAQTLSERRIELREDMVRTSPDAVRELSENLLAQEYASAKVREVYGWDWADVPRVIARGAAPPSIEVPAAETPNVVEALTQFYLLNCG